MAVAESRLYEELKSPRTIADAMGLPLVTIRHWLQHREENGLAVAVVTVGRKVFFIESKFDEWLRSCPEPLHGKEGAIAS